MNQEELIKIKLLQNLTGGFSEFVLNQIQLLTLANFPEAQKVEIQISDDELRLSLIPYTGLKGLWKKILHGRKKPNDQYTKFLSYWLPKTTEKRRIILQWQT